MERHSSLLQVPYGENCICILIYIYIYIYIYICIYIFILLFAYSRIVEILYNNDNNNNNNNNNNNKRCDTVKYELIVQYLFMAALITDSSPRYGQNCQTRPYLFVKITKIMVNNLDNLNTV